MALPRPAVRRALRTVPLRQYRLQKRMVLRNPRQIFLQQKESLIHLRMFCRQNISLIRQEERFPEKPGKTGEMPLSLKPLRLLLRGKRRLRRGLYRLRRRKRRKPNQLRSI